ncbi:MAG: DUF2231 domain-containing protein [Desulfomonilaceae bacterium]
MKRFSLEEIRNSDGKSGAPAVVVVKGKVYDVSASPRWKGGVHMKRHQAGKDLTIDIESAPHSIQVLERVQMVGVYEASVEIPTSSARAKVEAFLEKHPFFRRHPHPAVVHFPLALLMLTSFLEILAICAASPRTEWAAYLVFIIGLASLPVAIVTGYFTWWINYEAKDHPIIRQKRKLAWITLAVGIVAVIIRTFWLTDLLSISDPRLLIYLAFILSQSALVAKIGFLGGKLTFPY